MNERIKELAEQATSYKEGLVEGKHDIEVFDKEKFAELIVKECVQMFAENGYDESCDMLIEHWDIDPRTFRS